MSRFNFYFYKCAFYVHLDLLRCITFSFLHSYNILHSQEQANQPPYLHNETKIVHWNTLRNKNNFEGKTVSL